MIKLFGFGPNFNVADPSPFVLKVDAYMRMAGLEFESKPDLANLQKAPKGKLPYIEDKGKIISDSYFIINYLQKEYSVNLDNWLADEQLAIMHLVIKSLDENFYWCIVHSRWIREDTWPTIKKAFFSKMPFPLKHIAPLVARKGVKSALFKQGLGRHSAEEIMAITKDSLDSLSTMLGEKTYFFGDKPCSLDASAYAFLAELILTGIDSPINKLSLNYDNLVQYCKRIDQQYYRHKTDV